jgi:hypothetical protein
MRFVLLALALAAGALAVLVWALVPGLSGPAGLFLTLAGLFFVGAAVVDALHRLEKLLADRLPRRNP